MSSESIKAAAGTARSQVCYEHLDPADPGYPLPDGGFWGAFTRSLAGRWGQVKEEHEEATNTFDSDDADGQTRLVTDGGRDIDFAEEILDPPMYPEWEDVETWSKANLRYPVPGGWEIADHGKFHTTWEHEDGTELTRSSKRTPGTKDTFGFSVDGEEIHSVETGPQRVEMREETVWLLQFYDEKGIESVEEFEVEVRKKRNQSLDEFVTDGGEARAECRSRDDIERFVEHPDPDRFFIQIEPAEIEMDVHDHDDVELKTQLVPGGRFGVELTARFEYAGRDCSQHVSLNREAAESLYERLGECLEEDDRR
jgi:hypothetical protein